MPLGEGQTVVKHVGSGPWQRQPFAAVVESRSGWPGQTAIVHDGAEGRRLPSPRPCLSLPMFVLPRHSLRADKLDWRTQES